MFWTTYMVSSTCLYSNINRYSEGDIISNSIKFALLTLIILFSFIYVYADNPKITCKIKKDGLDCSFNGMICQTVGNDINCDLLETPFGSERKKIQIFGTEYVAGDNGRIYLQLLDAGQPVNNATCLIDLYKPDLTKMLDDAPMVWLNSSDGLYYYDLIIPNQLGVYMMTAKCLYLVDKKSYYATNSTVLNGTNVLNYYTYTWQQDNQYYSIKEYRAGGNQPYVLDFIIDFSNISIPSNYTGMNIYWFGNWNNNDEYVNMYVWNYCNSSWILLTNNITSLTTIVTQYLPFDKYNVNCIVNSGNLRLKFSDNLKTVDANQGTINNDYIYLDMVYTTFGQIENIRGSGELHVSRGISAQVNRQDIINALLENRDILSEHYKQLSNHNVCKDNTTLVHNITYEYCIGGDCSIHSYNREEICEYGCSNNACNPSPTVRILILLGIILAIPLIIWILSLGGLI